VRKKFEAGGRREGKRERIRFRTFTDKTPERESPENLTEAQVDFGATAKTLLSRRGA